MFGGKCKAVTFSYDDGVRQDARLIALFDKYGLKATFNINSELLGQVHDLPYKDRAVDHSEVTREAFRDVYRGHEVAVHTLTHPLLPNLDEAEIVRQVEEDRKNLEALAGYPVVGMAYPGGGVNNDERVAFVIRDRTAVRFARTIECTKTFDLQSDLYRFNPTVYHLDFEALFRLGDAFIALETDTPKLFYIWGHSYEIDYEPDYWQRLEDFCRLVSGHDDIFYGTNREVLLDMPPVPVL